MDQPQVKIGNVANLFVRMMHFEKEGDVEIGHTHSFDHLTLLAKGSLNVRINGQDTLFVAPQMIYIKAELVHELTAKSDNTVAYCIHALREKETGDIIDPEFVPKADELNAMMMALINK